MSPSGQIVAAEQTSVAEATQAATVHEAFVVAVELHAAGRLREAEERYRRICEVQPDHAESWSNLALALLGQGGAVEAAAVCRRAIEIRPDYLDAHLNLVSALEACRAFDEAADAYRRTIVLAPTRPELWNNYGVILKAQGKFAHAVLALREAIALRPDYADAILALAECLANLGWPEQAAEAYRQVVVLQPDHAAACSNLGTLLGGFGRFEEAVDISMRAAALAPQSPEVFCNLGVVLQRGGRVAEGVLAYQRALELRPDYASVYGNLGAGLQELFRFDEAAAALQRAVDLNPGFDSAVTELIKIRRHICDWSRYDEDHKSLITFLEQGRDAVFMLILMSFPSTPQQQLACARLAMMRLNESESRVGPHGRKARGERIRIGYLSTDFRDHPVGRLLPELFGLHDRARFEVIGYGLGLDDPGLLRRRIREACDHFVDLHGMSDAAAAQRIHADAVDILIDLTGPTVGSRLEILAQRPAPVQVSFLGWPGTMGADCIDYLIADPILVPMEQQPFFAEKIVHLPDCYQPSDPLRTIAEPRPARAECGLPEQAFVFCSFNNPVKITPDLFALWMRVLLRVENSVLWLYCKSERTKANLRQFAAQHGVAAERIIFASVASMEVYLGRLQLADLFLDSHPYNAGATCNDALWVGLPVLTCAGETYVTRMAASLLTAAGLPELVTTTLVDYEEAAVRLAREPGLLDELKRRLVAGRCSSVLFDMPRFTTHLERAFERMADLWRRGEAPRSLPVEHEDGSPMAEAALEAA